MHVKFDCHCGCGLFSNVEEELADEGDRMGAAVAKAQTKIISQVGVVSIQIVGTQA